MTNTINLDLSDYMKIARLVNDAVSDESGVYEVEYTANGYTLIIEVEHEIEHREVQGGSYESYDFEHLWTIASEKFDVLGVTCFDPDGCNIDCCFNIRQLSDILN